MSGRKRPNSPASCEANSLFRGKKKQQRAPPTNPPVQQPPAPPAMIVPPAHFDYPIDPREHLRNLSAIIGLLKLYSSDILGSTAASSVQSFVSGGRSGDADADMVVNASTANGLDVSNNIPVADVAESVADADVDTAPAATSIANVASENAVASPATDGVEVLSDVEMAPPKIPPLRITQCFLLVRQTRSKIVPTRARNVKNS